MDINHNLLRGRFDWYLLLIVGYKYFSSLALFDVINIEIAWINLFF